MTDRLAPPALPRRRPASDACVEELQRRLGHDRVILDAGLRRQLSQDYAWLSPVLTEDLPDVPADVVVRPRSASELLETLAVAYEHEVAVTPRGRGTGNYGQAVPLAAGIVLDTTALVQPLEVGDGWIRAGAGVPFTALESAANRTGQELAMFPSTTNSVLGGFLSGGAGGSGSIEHGLLWEGFVDALEIAPCRPEPELQSVRGEGVLPHLHAYGTTGIIAEARVRLAARHQWTAVFASFDRYEEAAAAGAATMSFDPAPRNVSVDDPGLVHVLPRHPFVVPDRASLRVVADVSVVGAVRQVVGDHGGTVTGVAADATGYAIANSYNHVTLRAKRLDPAWCHVQVSGPVLLHDPDAVRATLPDAMLHLDGMQVGGHRGFGGLLISRWVDRPTLESGMAGLDALGVFVTNPHTWVLGAHVDLDVLRRVAATVDPKGLLNPGKLPAVAT
jgi:FAD/FMN-containing dehydrogenase